MMPDAHESVSVLAEKAGTPLLILGSLLASSRAAIHESTLRRVLLSHVLHDQLKLGKVRIHRQRDAGRTLECGIAAQELEAVLS
jgi:hypothetical protein